MLTFRTTPLISRNRLDIMCLQNCAPVAQLDRASDFESAGRPFESGRARQNFQSVTQSSSQPTGSACEISCETFSPPLLQDAHGIPSGIPDAVPVNFSRLPAGATVDLVFQLVKSATRNSFNSHPVSCLLLQSHG